MLPTTDDHIFFPHSKPCKFNTLTRARAHTHTRAHLRSDFNGGLAISNVVWRLARCGCVMGSQLYVTQVPTSFLKDSLALMHFVFMLPGNTEEGELAPMMFWILQPVCSLMLKHRMCHRVWFSCFYPPRPGLVIENSSHSNMAIGLFLRLTQALEIYHFCLITKNNS